MGAKDCNPKGLPHYSPPSTPPPSRFPLFSNKAASGNPRSVQSLRQSVSGPGFDRNAQGEVRIVTV